jgi:hypothetical protein
MKTRFFYIIVVLSILIACKKAEDRSCFKTVGAETTKEIYTAGFNQLHLKEHIIYTLVQDTVEKIVLTGGKNLLNLIDIQVADNILEIKNSNRCNFLRTYKKKVRAEVHFKDLINIDFEGTEELTNKDTLNLKWFFILIKNGAGPVKLNVNATSIDALISHGFGDFTFNGVTSNANFNIRSNGFCDVYGLKVKDSLTVISATPGTLKVNAQNTVFKAQIEADGNILYKGKAKNVSLNKLGKGNLINVN